MTRGGKPGEGNDKMESPENGEGLASMLPPDSSHIDCHR